jgi:hypothetical protein
MEEKKDYILPLGSQAMAHLSTKESYTQFSSEQGGVSPHSTPEIWHILEKLLPDQ